MTFMRGWDDRDVYSKFLKGGKKLNKASREANAIAVKYGQAKFTNETPIMMEEDLKIGQKDTTVDISDVKEINRELDRMRKSGQLSNFKSIGERNRAFLAYLIKYHVSKDKDYVIACSGEEGSGKSAAVIQLGMDIMGCKSDFAKRKFLVENIVYDPTSNEMRKKIKGAKPGTVIIIDEAMKALYKRNYNTTTQKSLNVLFSTIRKKNLIVFMCIPNFFDLDKYFRTHRIKTWIFTALRGRGIVFKRSNSPFADDPWEQRKNQQALEDMDDANYGKMADKIQIVKNLRQLKSYGLEFDFDDFSKEVKDLYTQYKWWGGTEPNPDVEEYSEVSEKEVKMFKAETAMMSTVENLRSLNYKTEDISRIMNITQDKVKSIMKKIKDKKIKVEISKVKKIEDTFEENKELEKIEKKIREQKTKELKDESWKVEL